LENTLKRGDFGKEVKALQQILINEGVWEEKIEATGYFDPITKRALAKFQEIYRFEILKPLD
jgi:peptidoglycan hydrolase-like protein with peptidoglycan-binding domain